jgi:hypothetical protein
MNLAADNTVPRGVFVGYNNGLLGRSAEAAPVRRIENGQPYDRFTVDFSSNLQGKLRNPATRHGFA